MNENIVNFLNGYMLNPDPQYADSTEGQMGMRENSFYQSLDRYISETRG
mgnify:CR=1 FL=1